MEEVKRKGLNNVLNLSFSVVVTAEDIDDIMVSALEGGITHDEEPDDNAWYVEKWYDEDLINALKEIGVTASEKNLERLKSECLHIFDDKSTRNEMLADKAREIFEEE